MSTDKPTLPEEEYFARQEKELRAELKAKADAEKAQEEKAALKALHAGRCGRCGGALKTQTFRGVEIDVCPDCGSVLLDPGELEQLAGEDQTSVVGWLGSLFGKK